MLSRFLQKLNVIAAFCFLFAVILSSVKKVRLTLDKVARLCFTYTDTFFGNIQRVSFIGASLSLMFGVAWTTGCQWKGKIKLLLQFLFLVCLNFSMQVSWLELPMWQFHLPVQR